MGNFGEVFHELGFSETSTEEQIFFQRSTDHGKSFSSPTLAGTAICRSWPRRQITKYRCENPFPSLSVDRSRGTSRGTLYLVSDRRNSRPDRRCAGADRQLWFGEVMLSQSSDKGKTWTPAMAVRPTPHVAGSGHDQFLPAAAVDNEGTLAVCYSDRRLDPDNNRCRPTFASISHNQGESFTHIRNCPSRGLRLTSRTDWSTR